MVVFLNLNLVTLSPSIWADTLISCLLPIPTTKKSMGQYREIYLLGGDVGLSR